MKLNARIASSRGARLWPALALVTALVTMSGCSSSGKKPEPTPLSPVTALVPASLAWQVSVDEVDPLSVAAVNADTLVLANAAGVVQALEVRNGQTRWRVDTKAGLSAGVGSDGRQAAVVTQLNELVAVAADGEQWRTRLAARVFTPPLVAGDRVFVLAADRSVSAFDGKTGARLWTQASRGTDPLILQKPGVLLAVGDTLVVGVGGRLVGLSPANGALRWDAAIARPRGINEIERLVDLVGRVGRVDDQICARAFQSAVGCVDTARGTLQWAQPSDGATGLQADADRVYGVESNGRVVAWKRSNGERAWSSDRLLHRDVTAPLAAGRSVMVGDGQGYVHLLAREDGAVLNRLATDGSAIVAGPFLAGKTLIAVTRKGGVYGWRPE